MTNAHRLLCGEYRRTRKPAKRVAHAAERTGNSRRRFAQTKRRSEEKQDPTADERGLDCKSEKAFCVPFASGLRSFGIDAIIRINSNKIRFTFVSCCAMILPEPSGIRSEVY